ncbi:2'-5' RNA ligase [Quadrisphaera granulorum]|uniref:RNA 2',3'-cyclic phosphodiesterase n=1 Tax=Quadrisphaera granulorum TaxID=317664 RepID=A0A316A940_9ACTN|nr:RNA 2',3'-cyclic phosphodiesterase [Quadrisphaera granulorum]PWJ54211.1 2'-5' RNA ligase [Quadrisphaera granulorum]SZE96350.1 2'-5' RNA ligase [Quadrisphaera granulorum]
MRLFVSLEPPAEALQQVAEAVTELGHVPGVRWSPPSRWHVTLAFLGELDDDVVDPLVPLLRWAAASTGPVRLRLSGAGCFGSSVLWTGVAGDLERLSALAAAVARAARAGGVALEERPYRPHVTLARATGRGGSGALGRLADQLAELRGPTWTATEARLVRSHTSTGRYEVLEHLQLVAPSAPG